MEALQRSIRTTPKPASKKIKIGFLSGFSVQLSAQFSNKSGSLAILGEGEHVQALVQVLRGSHDRITKERNGSITITQPFPNGNMRKEFG